MTPDRAEPASTLAIIVPIGPGDGAWRQLLPQLAQPGIAALAPEVVLVIAPGHANELASLKAFCECHSLPRLSVLDSQPGRAIQMNLGAGASKAPWLWFLHADSVLSPGVAAALQAHIQGPPALGYFDLRFLTDGPPWMLLNTIGAQLRSRWFGMPFGDQGFVIERTWFERLAGYNPQLASGEDHDFVWRYRRAGGRLRALAVPLHTSARRYAEYGWLATTAKHLRLTWQQAIRFARGRGPQA